MKRKVSVVFISFFIVNNSFAQRVNKITDSVEWDKSINGYGFLGRWAVSRIRIEALLSWPSLILFQMSIRNWQANLKQ